MISSLASWVIDNLLYLTFFGAFSAFVSPEAISPAAHVSSRALSSMANFSMNYFYVFRRSESFWPACGKYYCLCLPQTAVSVLLVSWAVAALGEFAPGTAVALKMLIEAVLFCVSYLIQKKWVFKKAE